MERTTSWKVRLNGADARALAWIADRRPTALVATMRLITRTGDGGVVACALAAALIARPGRVSPLVAIATVLGLALFRQTKRWCRRERPLKANEKATVRPASNIAGSLRHVDAGRLRHEERVADLDQMA